MIAKNLTLLEETIPNYIDEKYLQHSIKDGRIISLPLLDIHSDKEEYLKYFNNCWLLTEALFSSLKYKESFYKTPYHQLRHPLIFYYGHVASLYVNKMLLAGLIDKPLNKEFEKILEIGVDEMTWDVDIKNNKIEWSDLEEIKLYRQKVYELVTKFINENTNLFGKQVSPKSPLWALLMSFEHERIHLETSSVLIREMEVVDLRIPKLFLAINHQQNSQSTIDYPKNEFVKIAAKKVSIGKQDQSTYGWDNEYGSREIEVESFLVSKFLISNGEFFEFVKNDGYHFDKYWCKNGLAWRKFRNTYHPTFWVPNGPKGSNLFKLRSCFEIIEMRWDYPAIVNHYEAQAFCRYKSKLENKNYHLPFEAQHNALHDFQSDPIKSTSTKNFNFNLQNLSENSVDANQQGSQVLCDIHGNVWQWLEDNFYPLKGFEIHKYYPDFSTPCFDDKYKMIAGSSFFSTGNLASIYSRYHFRPHFFQHCGFRIIKAEGSYFKKNIEIKFAAENPNDGKKYVIFTEDGELKILEKEGFEMLLRA